MKVCANLPNTNNICDQHKLYNKIEKHGVIPVTINDSNSTYQSVDSHHYNAFLPSDLHFF